MNINKLAIISLSISALMSACTVVPGSGLSTSNKNIVYAENETAGDVDLSNKVNVYPITLGLVESMRPPVKFAQNNQSLEQLKSNYNYRLGSGDVLNIIVWYHPDLNAPATSTTSNQNRQVSSGAWVDEQGNIFYPLIGKVHVRGKTLSQVQSELNSRLQKYIKNPQLDINITEFRSQKVAISGAVRQAGQGRHHAGQRLGTQRAAEPGPELLSPLLTGPAAAPGLSSQSHP